eukprot:TRINITY_DN4095_c0_g1_i10.p1 TRINITY_DN4095_c0_g1~~TRINITY_DN4095_c0_g1_i10.p1  ORF type:complete len:472 (-),score=175.36 TRINITY_DN4095_c0_g1_i10:298-1713(-)
MMLDMNALPKNANGIRTTHTCELCGFEPKTKNKYREKQDHLVMKHFKDRIDKIFPHCRPYTCPNPDCDFTGKDKQALLRHYTGKHGVLELYLREALAEKGIQYNISDSAKRKSMSQSERKAKEARLSPPQLHIQQQQQTQLQQPLSQQMTNIQVSPPIVTHNNHLSNPATLITSTLTIPPTVLTSTGNTTFPTIAAANTHQLPQQQHQTMMQPADTTTPFTTADLSEIVYTSTVTKVPVQQIPRFYPNLSSAANAQQLTTTRLPLLTNTPVSQQQTSLPPPPPLTQHQFPPSAMSISNNVTLNGGGVPPSTTTTTVKLPSIAKLPSVPTTKLPSMSTVLNNRQFTNQGKCDVDALLASFQPIDAQLVVTDLPLDSPLVSSTTPDFILPDEPTKLVLNDNIMWGSGNLPIIEPAQTVPVNYFDADGDFGDLDNLDIEYLSHQATVTATGATEPQSILTGGPSSERQLSFSML